MLTRRQAGWTLGIAVVGLLACKKGASSATLDNPQLGTLVRGPSGLAIEKPVTRLPRIAAPKGDIAHSFGICFDYTEGNDLGKVEVVVRPPAAVNTLRLEPGATASPSEIRLPAPPLNGSGTFCQDMYFDDDDPLGSWGFDLQRDGKTVKSWKLEVYDPG